MGIGLRMTNLNLDQQADESEVYNDIPHRSIIPGPNPDLVDGNEPDRPLDSSHEDGSGDQADNLTCSGDPGPSKSYELRRNVNRLGAESTHIDLDQSGDYDPVEEARSRSSRAAIAKRTKRSQEAKKDNEKNKRFSGKGNAVPISDQDIGFKGIVKLSFKAMDKVVGITSGVYRIPHSQRASHTRIPDPAGEDNDLTGHPVARGCKKCRLEDIECSMISDGRYPCSSCQNGKFECQRIVEIIATERCERCERYDQPDSFENAKDKVYVYAVLLSLFLLRLAFRLTDFLEDQTAYRMGLSVNLEQHATDALKQAAFIAKRNLPRYISPTASTSIKFFIAKIGTGKTAPTVVR